MIKLIMIATLLMLCNIGAEAENQFVELWKGSVPGSEKGKQAWVKDPKSAEKDLRITEVTNPMLEVYTPVGAGNGVAVVVCPGGGYNILAYDKEGAEIAQWLAKQGFTAFVLSYRVPKQRDGALQDVQRAIRVVRHEYKLDRVGVIGFSAGGSLSARASTHFNDTTYPAVDQADQLSSRPDFTMLIYPAYLDEGANRSLTPEITLSPQTPPMFIFGTSDDMYGNSALVMAQALRDHKIPSELHFMAVGGHGYGMRRGAGLQWTPLAETWLQGVLKK